ncbi:MAG: hypothetical protein OXF52_04420, partial [Candidatus Dadabacteria bacterium]|nr:hypothetical protein [Candidatus Dadabacteria bacterium]
MKQRKLMLAEYPLRSYERELALMELRGLLPDARTRENNGLISVETSDPQADHKLKRLTFFSRFRDNTGDWKPTVQHELESLESGQKGIRKIRYLTHGLHEYKGRFYPQLAKALMNAIGGGHGTVLDPFSGCGTLLLEAALNGSPAVGVDINPIGWMIARAKIASLRLGKKSIAKMRCKFCMECPVTKPVSSLSGGVNMEYLRRWFPEDNLREILQLDTEIQDSFSGNDSLFLKVVLSESLKRFSWQVPSEQRIRRRKDSPPNNVRKFFGERLLSHLAKVESLQHVQRISPPKANVLLGDARALPIKSGSIDFVVTSPPYATALPYIDADRLSLFFFGLVDRRKFTRLERDSIGNREISTSARRMWEEQIPHARANDELPEEILDFLEEMRDRNMRANVGFRRRNTAALLCKYFLDMRSAIREMRRVLKPNGPVALVVGDNFTVAGETRMEIPTARFINLIAQQNGFHLKRELNTAPPTAYNIYSRNA